MHRKITNNTLKKLFKKPKKQKNNVNAFLVVKEFLKYIKQEKRRFLVGFIISFFNATFYIIGTIFIGYIFRKYIETAITNHNNYTLDIKGFSIDMSIMTIAFILYWIFRYWEKRIYIKITYESSGRMRKEVMEKLLKMPISYYDSQKAGDLISTLINDINNVSNTLFGVLNTAIFNFFSILFSIIFMFLTSAKLTLIVIPMAVFMFGLSLLVLKKSQPLFIKQQDAWGQLGAVVEEMIHNTKVTNAFNQRKTVMNEFSKIARNIKKTAFKGDLISRSIDPWFGLTLYVINLSVAFIGVYFYLTKVQIWGINGLGVDSQGHATAGFIITYIALNWNLLGPVQDLLLLNFKIQLGIASSNRIFKLLELNDKSANIENITFENVSGQVIFKNVWFKYNKDSENYQLKDASFIAKKGQKIAIVGPTGAGKTTIVNLLSKFYDYDKGSILIDKYELKNISKNNLRSFMSIVLQDSFFFNDTIMNNLKLANPQAKDEDIIQIAKLIGAHHFILSMEKGYDTLIENNGANLSHGQRQMFSIIQAILADKQILILDEATSNVDSFTEEIIQNALNKLMENKTSFIIAHRLSTIKNADLILVVKAGVIIERGTHQELMDQKGFYYSLNTTHYNN
ncbi:ABC transporter ATP-binding protein [Mycoplasmopsis ciconiae]|uniref:ABC transporter ATP-binding protein n=1 Tax=Mycoplasmopsis ciconiae TaxID=561067 RepID=A0ABU7MM36_9BACT|nr:ABC transporter ATP-binding protein [Mycoplasmopsis ciconiae]